MKYCKDCWSFGRCNADGKTVDFPVDGGVCIDFDECKPMTNADRIRAMSDEELAELLEEMTYDSMEHRAEYWLRWLKQPPKGE